MSNILIALIICIGMAIGLFMFSPQISETKTSSAATIPADTETASAETENVTLMSSEYINEILQFSTYREPAGSYLANKEYIELRNMIEPLKQEIAKTENGSAEQEMLIEKLNFLWSRISVLLGEENSRAEIITEAIFKKSQETENSVATSENCYAMLNYKLEENFV